MSRDDVAFLPPTFFRTMDGWHYHDSGQGTPGGSAWAANVPFDPADLSPTSPAIPPETIAALRPGDVVLTALAVSSLHQAEDGPWPPGSLAPLELADAIVRGPDAEEPPGDYAVYELQGYALIRVYFGEPHPSPDEVAAAQWQLDGLEVPPTCPVPAKGSFPDTMQLSEDTVAPGSDIVVTGLMPFQREDGSYDREASSVIELWWDGDPATWEQLFADPASTGATLVGSGGQGSCFLDATITIPADAAPGDHTIVGLNTDAQHTGAALYGSVVVHLVGP